MNNLNGSNMSVMQISQIVYMYCLLLFENQINMFPKHFVYYEGIFGQSSKSQRCCSFKLQLKVVSSPGIFGACPPTWLIVLCETKRNEVKNLYFAR